MKIGLSEGQLVVRNSATGKVRKFPFEAIDGISVFGQSQLSTQLIRECISTNKDVGYYSDSGHYFGHISSSLSIDPVRQKKQIYLTDNTEFCIQWSRNIVSAKIKNSITLLESMKDVYEFGMDDFHGLRHSLKNLENAESVEAILGFEGNAAKNYFQCLPKVLRDEKFYFYGRSSRPPKDPFNSMISFGYSIFYRNIIGAIERHGLHPYFAYLHKLKFGHAALASDLIEEYRAPLIDKTVVEFVNSGDIGTTDFYKNDAGAVCMNRETSKRLTDRFSEIIAKSQTYFYDDDDKRSYGFAVMLDKKINKLVDAIEKRDASIYKPFLWRQEQ